MHEGPHYRLRRLASTHPFEDPTDHDESEGSRAGAESVQDVLIYNFFMPPPDEAPAVKYGAVVRDTLEMVDQLLLSLISTQNSHPLLEVLEFANSCRNVVNRMSDSLSDPILFAGSFSEYYLHSLRNILVDRRRTLDNIRYALGGGIPSVIRACENLREKIIEAKRVFRSVAADLARFLREHDRTDAQMATTHPFTLKTVHTFHLILHKFDQMDQFCRSFEEYFGHRQFHHLRNLLDVFNKEAVIHPSREEIDGMIHLWTHYARFTLHFPYELDTVTEFFQSNAGNYHVFSTASTPTSEESRSVYSESSTSLHRCQAFTCNFRVDRFKLVRKETRRVRSWICVKTTRCYHQFQFWLHEKHLAK